MKNERVDQFRFRSMAIERSALGQATNQTRT
jgi:hypothetical protein